MIEIREVEGTEDLSDFATGNPAADRWVHLHATRARRYGTAIVYGLSVDGAIIGIYALSAHALEREATASNWLRRNTPDRIPAILLGMLGVIESEHGRGYGARLLQDAIKRSLRAAKIIGAKALIVDPTDEEVQAFYRHFGFGKLGESGRLFLPLNLEP